MAKINGAVNPKGLAAPLICGKISISGGTVDGLSNRKKSVRIPSGTP